MLHFSVKKNVKNIPQTQLHCVQFFLSQNCWQHSTSCLVNVHCPLVSCMHENCAQWLYGCYRQQFSCKSMVIYTVFQKANCVSYVFESFRKTNRNIHLVSKKCPLLNLLQLEKTWTNIHKFLASNILISWLLKAFIISHQTSCLLNLLCNFSG